MADTEPDAEILRGGTTGELGENSPQAFDTFDHATRTVRCREREHHGLASVLDLPPGD